MSVLVSLVLTNAATAAVLALLAWLVSLRCRRQALVHGLWLLAIAKLVTPPLLPLRVLPSWSSLWPAPSVVVVPIPPPARREAVRPAPAPLGLASPTMLAGHEGTATPPLLASREATATPRAAAATADGRRTLPASLPAATAALLTLGALAVLTLTTTRFLRFRRLLALGEPGGPFVARRAQELGRRLGLRRTPAVWLVREELPPLLWPSAPLPRLVMSTGLLSQLTGQELDALLAHELAHVRRGDHWVRLVEVAATAFFWWYPVAWWSRRALRRAEERCCDEWVLRVLPSSAEAYASGLLKSLTFVSGAAAPLPAGASGAGPVHDLEARLEEILMTRPLPQLGRPFRLALAAAAALGLAVFPTSAQPRGVALDSAPRAVTTDESATPPAPASAAPAVVATPRAVRVPNTVRALVAPHAVAAVTAGVAAGVQGGVAGGVVAGVPGGVDGGVAGGADDDPALAAERRALEDQRRQLHQQQLELEGRALELEERSEQARRKAEADRLRAEGRTAELARVEQEGALLARRHELRRNQLQLEREHANLEADLERAERADDERVAALEKAGQDRQADELRRELAGAQEKRSLAARALEQKEQALEVEMEKLDQEQRAFESEHRVQELRQSSDELRQELAERIDSLREALPEAGAQRADLEAEIRKLQAALDALGKAPRPSPGAAPRPQP